MVIGLDSFQRWFQGFENQYVVIGGTACDLLMAEEGMDFRATKDIDLVLIVEAITPEFVIRFWEYIKLGDYHNWVESSGKPQFYRFTHPKHADFPHMIELFTRHMETILLPEHAVLTPLPVNEDISSLSAILLDDDYFELLRSGRTAVGGVTVLDAGFLILFKAKAWLDLTKRKVNGETVDSKNIRKHKKDVFRLSELLGKNTEILVPIPVYQDFQSFISAMWQEDTDTKQLGLTRTRDEILKILQNVYIAEGRQRGREKIDNPPFPML